MTEAVTTLQAPLAGWSTPLEEAPDEVFAARVLGDGLAIDPTSATLCAPCAGEVILIAQTRHAVTLRADSGGEILLHVGIDSVALGGAGFEVHVPAGGRVRPGERLLSFDLDLLARRATSVLTPIIVTADSGARILRQNLARELAVGDFLMEISAAPAATATAAPGAPAHAALLTRRVTVRLEHGIHARPAAQLAAALRPLAADVRVGAHGREANARSPVALMGLGVRRGDEIELRAGGPDVAHALEAASAVLAHAAPAAPAGSPKVAAPAPPPRAAHGPGELGGVIASRGFAVGSAVQLRRAEVVVSEAGRGVALEHAALDQARALVRARLQRRTLAAPAAPAAGAAREIAAAHLELLDDPELLGTARTHIEQGKSAGYAWRAAVAASAAVLRSLADARLRERVDDLLDLETQVLTALAGSAAPPAPQLPAEAIVISRELLPSQLAALDAARLAGLAMAAGGATSHVAILAAAMGIPTLVALGPEVQSLADGTPLILDAERGVLEIHPEAQRLAAARAELAAGRARSAALQAAAQRECRTADGTRIEVFANLGSLSEVASAVQNGAEGCGLLRTEFLFLERALAPDEAEQLAEYQRIAQALGGRPLTIRTLDAGGDKPIAYLPLPPEDNPALGLRGVRTSFAFPELLVTQLRAVLAVRPAGQCRVLVPMISAVEELERVRAVLEQVRGELNPRVPIELGVMIETPAAALLAERLAALADFLSIGTNDLTQYTLAMDRLHPQLAPQLDALHPAVLELIARAAHGARAHGRHAAVCGGLASEPLAAALLVGLGVQELSAVPTVIPQLKARLATVTMAQCQALAQQALALPTAAAVRTLLQRQAGGTA